MKTAFYHHGAAPTKDVAEALEASGKSVVGRNANYFNERETEKFGRVVVDDGANTDAIRAAYKEAGVEVVGIDAFLKEKGAAAAAPAPKGETAPAATPATSEKPAAKGGKKAADFNPDAPRGNAKPGKKQGEASTAAPATEKQGQ